MLAAMMIATVVAQPVPGTWTGYVNGWVSSSAAPTRSVFSPLRRQVRPTLVYAPVPYVMQPPAPSVDLEQERVIAQQAALIAQQQAAQAQMLAQQAQLAVEQQRLQAEAQRQQTQLRQRELDAEATGIAEEQTRRLHAEQEAREREVVAREAARLADARAQPSGKSAAVYRWTDGEGVVYYSTRPPK